MLCIVGLGKTMPMLAMTLYAWASDDAEFTKKTRNEALAEAAMQELALWPSLPLLIAADLNGDIAHSPPFATPIRERRLFDVGGIANTWGAIASQPTAWAHNSKAPT